MLSRIEQLEHRITQLERRNDAFDAHAAVVLEKFRAEHEQATAPDPADGPLKADIKKMLRDAVR